MARLNSSSSRIICLTLALFAFLAPASITRAQCADWLVGALSNATNGANGEIAAVTLWDPDGFSGPLPYWLVVGGDFTEIGGVAANHIAAFDGTQWRALGAGTDRAVFALKQYNGDLVAGDGDTGTDHDIEAFFRVLSGGPY